MTRKTAPPKIAPSKTESAKTEPLALENALREAEEHYRATVEFSPVTLWTASPSGLLLSYPMRWLELSGLTQEEVLGNGWQRLLHPADHDKMLAAWSAALATGEPFDAQYRFRVADGTHRWVWTRATPRRDSQGNIVRWYGSSEDIHVQRLAEEARQGTEVELKTVTDVVQMLVAFVDCDLVYRFANRAYEDWFHVKRSSVIGSRVSDIIGAAAFAERLPLMQRALAGEAILCEVSETAPGGGFREAEIRYLPHHTPDGEIDGLYIFGSDITSRKQAERVLRDMNEILERRIEERTAALKAEMVERQRTEEALRQSQKMETIGQLTGGIAHDFNNLLTGIIGGLELLRRRVVAGRTGEILPLVDMAMGSAHRAGGLTQRLLTFARRQSLSCEKVDLDQLFRSIRGLLSGTLKEQIELVISSKAGLWPVDTDAHQIESALLNLAINARDAMPRGGKLTISASNMRFAADRRDASGEIKAGDYVVVDVADTGIGMTPAVKAKAFDPFFTTKPKGQGTGLGLSIIYGFVRQSGGYVTIDSEIDRGTSIKLFLPRFSRDDAAVGDTDRPQRRAEAGAGETVLVVEDDPTVRAFLLEVLADLDYAVCEAADGPAALPLLESTARIDLMVTDVGLPGLNGRDLAAAARRHRPGLKILFITGYAEKAASAEVLTDADTDVILKPFGLDAVGLKIRQMIRGAKPA
jgi:PAS domain S-box-containing protein